LAPGDQAAVALTESDLGLPTDVLDHLGHCFQPQLQVAADLGWVAVGPGSLDEYASGVGVPSLGDAPLTTALPRSVFTGDETQVAHELSRILEAGEVAQFGHQGDGGEELHAAPGLKGFHYWQPAPALHQGGKVGFQALHALGM